MAAYTIEDIELIRRKSGISYQEAVSLLDYHNGNVARALVDLERNGRIKDEGSDKGSTSSSGKKAKTSSGASGKGGGLPRLVNRLYRARVKVTKDETPVINLSALYCIAGFVFAPHMVIVGVIASLVLGYKFSFTKNDPAFAGENLERMVRSAADNVKSSMGDFARGFQEDDEEEPAAQSAPQQKSAGNNGGQSYYAAAPAQKQSAASYRANVPTMNVPVQVESQDGSVTVEDDSEGFTSATIE